MSNVDEPEEPGDGGALQFGLRPFQHESMCPKCGSTGIRAVYHPCVVLTLGDGQFPCASWMLSGILTPEVSQHLCLRCARCGYGWPTKTADVAPVEGLEEDLG
jgi:predicted nucleic-acid-binding Zn-ribbon protein